MAVADGFLRHQRFGRDGAESTTKAYAHAIALFLRWCVRTQRSWQSGVERIGVFVTWLAHAGPQACSAEAINAKSVVLAGGGNGAGAVGVADQRCAHGGAGHGGACGRPGAGPGRFGFGALRGRSMTATCPSRRAGRTVRWRGGCGCGIGCGNRKTCVDRASDTQIVALLEACRSARDRLIVLLMARAGLRRGELCGLRRWGCAPVGGFAAAGPPGWPGLIRTCWVGEGEQPEPGVGEIAAAAGRAA